MTFRKNIYLLSIIIFAPLLVACSILGGTKEIIPTPTFTITNKDETMPVWVEGNPQSSYIIVAVHGGPGSDVLDFRNYKGGVGFRKIEKNYMVAYWQQRGSGQSYGSNLGKRQYNIAQYAEDADAVVDHLKQAYPGKKIIFLGHSWGGMLVSSYLSDPQRAAKITAWIDAAGAHNGTILLQKTRDDITREAQLRIKKGENLSYWQDVLDKIKRNPESANLMAYDVVEKIPEVPIKVPTSDVLSGLTQRAMKSNYILSPQILRTNNTAAIAKINLPLLLIWGEYDFVVSKALRDEVRTVVAKPLLTNVTLSQSAHSMMFEEPDGFANAVISFVQNLR